MKERRLMARQKSEDRVLLEGGVMPAERFGSSPGAQGKAIPVEQTAGQLRLPIATLRPGWLPFRQDRRASDAVSVVSLQYPE